MTIRIIKTGLTQAEVKKALKEQAEKYASWSDASGDGSLFTDYETLYDDAGYTVADVPKEIIPLANGNIKIKINVSDFPRAYRQEAEGTIADLEGMVKSALPKATPKKPKTKVEV